MIEFIFYLHFCSEQTSGNRGTQSHGTKADLLICPPGRQKIAAGGPSGDSDSASGEKGVGEDLMKHLLFAVCLIVAQPGLVGFLVGGHGSGVIHRPGSLYGQTPSVPTEYQDLYSALGVSISSFESTINSSWDGSTYPVAFSAELKSAHSNQGSRLLAPNYYTGVLLELDSLKALGVKAITVAIQFPVLYAGFYQDPAEYQQYVDFYTRLAADVRARNLKLIVKTGFLFHQGGFTTLDVKPFYDSLTLDQYNTGRMETARTIALLVKPDYLAVISEPDTEAIQSGKPELGTVEGSANLLDVILAGLQKAGVQGVAVGAGVGSWMPSYKSFVEAFASRPVNFIDVRIHPVNLNNLPRLLEIVNLASQYGKPVGVSEAWLYKIRDSELLTLLPTQVFARDSFSFWSSLDSRFLAMLMKFAHSRRLEFFSPPWTERFHAYLDYTATLSLTPAETFMLGQTEASRQISAGQYTSTGLDYARSLIQPPDSTAPTTPTGVWAGTVATGITALWKASTDNVGVAGYTVYRDDVQISTTAALYYQDTGVAPGTTHTYRIAAYDVSGNVSASSATVSAIAGGTESTPPSVPKNLSGRALANARIYLWWSPSTDNVLVTGYQIYRGTSPNSLIQIATTVGAFYTDSGLAPATTYYYAVAAYDLAGNTSALPSTISVRTRNR